MPKGDRTGPGGSGARSGRKVGLCSGFDMPGYANANQAGGAGIGRWRRNRCWGDPIIGGRGMRQRFFPGAPPAASTFDSQAPAAPASKPEEEIDALKNRSRALQSELDTINKRLEALDSQKEKKE